MTENVNLAWALYFQKLGLSIFPVRSSDKMPLVAWKEFQTRCANEEEIKKWWELYPNADIGMVTGRITGRLVLDIDGPEGSESISGCAIPATPAVRTRRGVQYHFRWPNEHLDKTTLAGVRTGVDTRGEGGYVKLPPSMCSDGTRYEWINDFTTPLAEAPEWLLAELRPKSHKNLGSRDGRDPERVAHDGENDSGYSDNWMAAILDGVGQGQRHQAFVKLAGYYFNCMHPDIAAQHLLEWNMKNTPPLEDIGAKISDFTKRFKSGEYDSDFLAKKAAEPKDLTLVTATELISQHAHRPEYLAEKLIPMSCSVIFAGWQGLGKTFVATDLAIEVSKKTGPGMWLGEFPTKKGPVLWVDNEMGGGLTSYRLRQLLQAKHLKPEDLSLYYHARNRLKLTSEKHYNQLKAEMAQIKPVLVVIDSMASCHTLNENESKDMRHFFDDIVAPLCEEFKCVMMFVDHERKQQPGASFSGGQRLRGSGAKGDSVDAILSLDKKEDVLMFEHSKSRYSRRLDPFAIEILDVANGVIVRKMEPNS